MPIAIALIVLLLDATRRTMGWSMVVLTVVFLAYALGRQYFPDLISHRRYDLPRVLEQVYLGADSIFGTPLGVSATFVIVIVILDALLERSGASDVLMGIAIPVFIMALLVGYSAMYSSLAGILCVLGLSVLKKSNRTGPGASATPVEPPPTTTMGVARE
ncbi:MAG: TRAP-type uncharacterized transport system fused permease subunit [Hyphomicrobiaceae bacterium]|jgi:TRAP-type uncharacterized transport system fused permease subunit